MALPLEGILVLEWGVFVTAPLAASMLADLGAEVIKIEEPIRGDLNRGIKEFGGVPFVHRGQYLCHVHNNQNKKSITVNLKTETGKEIVHKLAERADVFMHNFRASVAEGLEMDYATLSRRNPRLIYAVATAYGSKGPDAELPALDLTLMARSGLMLSVGEPGMPPLVVTGPPADMVTASHLAYGVLAALLGRERLGFGQVVEAPMFASMIHLQRFNFFSSLLLNSELPRFCRGTQSNPLYNYYLCGDGKWIALCMATSDRDWPKFCQAVGMAWAENDQRFYDAQARQKNNIELISILNDLFSSRARDEWLKALGAEGKLNCAPVNTVTEARDDPQVLANEMITEYEDPNLGTVRFPGYPVRLSETPARISLPPPELGQHTEEVLLGLGGYTWDEIVKFRNEGVI